MGAGQSGMEIGGSSMGYQVLRVYPDSPGSKAGLKAYFDFIIAIGNTRFNKENGSLREILKASVDQKLKMIVLNTRTKSTREVEIVPSFNWGGNGLLGVSIKHSSFDRADDRVWHVVEVEPGSPAYQAGFKAGKDYIIGSDSILQENDDLYNLVETHEGKALKLFVYNVETDNCREVICHPNSKWGGKGYLGCEFGHGLLHRIPYNSGAGNGGNISESSRAPLLRNEQSPAKEQQFAPQQAATTSNNNTYTFQNQLMQQQMQNLQNPGNQLFQKALLDLPPVQQQVPQGVSQQSQSLQQMQQQLQQQMQQQQQAQPPQQQQQYQQPQMQPPQMSQPQHQQPLMPQPYGQQMQQQFGQQQQQQLHQPQQQLAQQPQQFQQPQQMQVPPPQMLPTQPPSLSPPIQQNSQLFQQSQPSPPAQQQQTAPQEPMHQLPPLPQQQPERAQANQQQQQPPVYPPPYSQPMYPQPEYQQQASPNYQQPSTIHHHQQSAQPEPPKSAAEMMLPPPPQMQPQTFAQLATIQQQLNDTSNPYRGLQ